MNAFFLGKSDKKVTHPKNRESGVLSDFQIRIGDVSLFTPRTIKIRHPKHGWHWEWPYSMKSWPPVVWPTKDFNNWILSFACPSDAAELCGRFYDEDYTPFEVDIECWSGEIEKLIVEDGRGKATAEEESEYLCGLMDSLPEAVPEVDRCDVTSEVDKMERADQIIKNFFGNVDGLKNVKFLDFGCGEGHVANQVSLAGAELSVGYDILPPIFNSSVRLLTTTDYNVVTKHAPYDIILLFDVLDHVDNQVEVLSQVKKLCKLNTIFYCRCHPWSSRHGGHVHKSLNKAFAHVIFTEEELKKFDCDAIKGCKIKNPNQEYYKLFRENGFRIASRDVEQTEVERIFKDDQLIRKRFKESGVNLRNAAFSFFDFRLELM